MGAGQGPPHVWIFSLQDPAGVQETHHLGALD